MYNLGRSPVLLVVKSILKSIHDNCLLHVCFLFCLGSSHDIQTKRQGMCLARPQGGHRPASAVEGERRVLIPLKPQWTREVSQPGSTMASCTGCFSADARREVEAVQHYWPVVILFLLDGILAPEINHGRPCERVALEVLGTVARAASLQGLRQSPTVPRSLFSPQ